MQEPYGEGFASQPAPSLAGMTTRPRYEGKTGGTTGQVIEARNAWQTVRKRMQANLEEIKIGLRQRMHDSLPEVGKWLKSVVDGHIR